MECRKGRSVLSPILFLVATNEIDVFLDGNTLLFADGTILLGRERTGRGNGRTSAGEIWLLVRL